MIEDTSSSAGWLQRCAEGGPLQSAAAVNAPRMSGAAQGAYRLVTSATSIPVRTLVSAMGHNVMWAVGKSRKAPRVCAAALVRPPVLHHAASTHVGIVVYAHTHHLSHSLGDCGAPERYARLPAARKQRRKLPPSAARSHETANA